MNAIAKTLVPAFAAIATLTFGARQAVSQSTSGQPTANLDIRYTESGHTGYAYGYRAATAAESFARGQADLVRAYGEANKAHAEAQIHWEHAKAKAIANHQTRVETYFRLRKSREETRIREIAASRHSKQQLAAVARKSAPQRLSVGHWDQYTDGLAWPAALDRAEHATAKARVDEIFRSRRATTHGLSQGETEEVEALVAGLTTSLKSTIHEVSGTDYSAAKRFLTSLAYEATLVPTGEQLAGK